MRYLRLIMYLWRYSLMREMTYAKNFIFLMLVQIGWFAVQMLTIEIIFSHTTTLVGWSKYEALALVAIFSMVIGILRLLFETSFTQFCADVRDGSFDFYLARPCDPRFFLSFRRLTLENVGVVAFNVGLLLVLAVRGMIHVTFSSVLGFFMLLVPAFVIGYCLWFMLTLFIFWSPAIEQFNYLYVTVLTALRYPLDIYGETVRRLLLTLFPIGFLATIPAEFLLGMGTWQGVVLSFLIASIVFVSARVWWRFAVRHYASASS